MYKEPITMLTRPRPLFRARSPTPPDPKPWIDTLSALASLVFVVVEVLRGGEVGAFTPDISSNVVGGVRVPWVEGEPALGSSVDSGPPDDEGKTGIDMRCRSLCCAPETGDSGLLAVGVCEARLENCAVPDSGLAQLGALSIDPLCEAGEAIVGKTIIDLASAVISANRVEVRSHMMVFSVVVFSRAIGGTSNVSSGKRACRVWDVDSNAMTQ